MRKLIICGCALAGLLQISCGSQPEDPDPEPRIAALPPSTPSGGRRGRMQIKNPANNPPPVAPQFFDPNGPDSGLRNPFATQQKKQQPVVPNINIPPKTKQKDPPEEKPKNNEGKKPPMDKGQTKPGMKKPDDKPGFQVKPPDKIVQPKNPDIKKFTGSQYGSIGGKTIDDWIKEIKSSDPSKVENAIRTVLLFPPELAQKAAPVILRELYYKHDHKYRNKNKYLDVSIRVNGVIALGELLQQGMRPEPAAITVRDGVKVLVRYLKEDKQVLVRYKAALALASMGPQATAAIPALASTVYDGTTWEIRQASALALGRTGHDPKKGPDLRALRALYGAVKIDKASQVRLAAIQGLVYLGPPPMADQRKIVRDKLDEVAFQDPDGQVQIWAHLAVMTMAGKVEPERLKWIGRLLQHKELNVRIQAVKAFAAIRLEGKSEIPNLVAALDDPEPTVIYWTIIALATMKRWGEPALGRLHQLAEDEKKPMMLRQMAQETISIIEGKSEKLKEKK